MTTVKELKAQAKARGIKGFSTMKKAELEKALGGSAPKKGLTRAQAIKKVFAEEKAELLKENPKYKFSKLGMSATGMGGKFSYDVEKPNGDIFLQILDTDKVRELMGEKVARKFVTDKAPAKKAPAPKKEPKKMTKKQQVDKAFDEIEAKIDKSPRARAQRERLSDIWGYNIYSGNLKADILKQINKGLKPMAGGIMNLLEVLGLDLANRIMIREDNAGYEDLTPAEKKKSVALKKRVAKKTA